MIGQTIFGVNPSPLFIGDGDRVDTPRDDPDPPRIETVGDQVTAHRLARAGDEVGSTGSFDRPGEQPGTVTGQPVGTGQERDVVQGHQLWCPGRRRDLRGGVTHVDRTRGRLDAGPAEAGPCLVEPGSGERKHPHRDRGHPLRPGWRGVATSDSDDVEILDRSITRSAELEQLGQDP